MTSQHHPHTGHELSRARAHEGDRVQQDHDKGGHQGGHGKAPSPVDIQKARSARTPTASCSTCCDAFPSGSTRRRRRYRRRSAS
ncbi:Tryptophan synthase subunit beta like protein [Burkholderia pseudomallei]|nr:Tryptophan synthase subunit beta like protein [Burkholderia pseudomallei]